MKYRHGSPPSPLAAKIRLLRAASSATCEEIDGPPVSAGLGYLQTALLAQIVIVSSSPGASFFAPRNIDNRKGSISKCVLKLSSLELFGFHAERCAERRVRAGRPGPGVTVGGGVEGTGAGVRFGVRVVVVVVRLGLGLEADDS